MSREFKEIGQNCDLCNGKIIREDDGLNGCTCFNVAPCSYCVDSVHICDKCGEVYDQ
jgi:hypothetical protein